MKPATINELLSVSPRFMRSVNLERDFRDTKALEGYVSTKETELHLKRIGTALRPESGQRAWRITGDFGSGKSSFALLLANLLGRSSSELPQSARALRKSLEIRSNAPKLLPVLVTGSREPMGRAVLRGLLSALSQSIDGRKKLTCREELKQILDSSEIDDRTALRLVEQASKELVTKNGYGGILLIIDELGKFLEFASLHPEKQDAYFLQSLAESSSRSGDFPLYTLGLLHQGFAEYAERLPSTVQREWAKIAERFEEVPFSQPLGQVATLLSVFLSPNIEHGSLWGWKGKATEEMRAAIELGMFGPSVPKTTLGSLASGLYPLHPTVIPVLARFFRRFGQNERSLFSFLLSSEPYALPDFATQDAGVETVYRLSNFYDFAAFNFAHQLGSQSFRSHWNHIDAVIRSAEPESENVVALLKTVGILNVLESPELRPTLEVLELATGDFDGLSKLLSSLCQRNILFNRGSAGFALWPYTSVNLEQRLDAAREALPQASPIPDTVQARLDTRPIVARRHYIQTGNLRHFTVQFFGANELGTTLEKPSFHYPADGMIAVVLCESAVERQQAQDLVKTLGRDAAGLIVAISPPLESLSGSALGLERWLWVERHTPELKDDRFAAEEVQRQIAISRQSLENRIQDYVGFRTGGVSDEKVGITWFHRGESITDLVSEGRLQTFVSNLCDQLFAQAPLIRNELVNRHTLSSAAAAARQKLFIAMLERASEEYLGMPNDKAPPEKSMYLSILREGSIHREGTKKWEIGLPLNSKNGDPLRLRPALEAILIKLEEIPDQRVAVSEFYELLRSEPYGVRDGVIPILLLVIFIIHEPEIALYEDGNFQPEIEEFLFSRFAKRPETFELQLCKITGVRKAIIKELATVVESDRAEVSQLLSIVRPLYMFVANLPEYVRNTDQLSPKTLALRKAIGAAKEPGTLVYSEIPKALGFKNEPRSKPDATELAVALGKSIAELRHSFSDLHARMSGEILSAFDFDGVLEDWRNQVAESAEVILVGLGDPDFRAFCFKLADTNNAEAEWMEALGSLLTRRPPSRWKDRDELVFKERIHTLAGQFNRVLATCFDENGALPGKALRVAVTARSGEEKNVVIDMSSQKMSKLPSQIEKLRKQLPADDTVALAALSKLLSEMIG